MSAGVTLQFRSRLAAALKEAGIGVTATSEALATKCWPATVADPSPVRPRSYKVTLSNAVSALRKHEGFVIETMPRKGYSLTWAPEPKET